MVTYTCDLCGSSKEFNSVKQIGSPPQRWQVVGIKLICPSCVTWIEKESIRRKEIRDG